MNSKLTYKKKIFLQTQAAKDYVYEIGAVQRVINCVKCNTLVSLELRDSEWWTYLFYRCNNKNCRSTTSLLYFSIFRACRIHIHVLLIVINCILAKVSNNIANLILPISEKTHINIKTKFSVFYDLFLNVDRKMGGFGTYLEVDEVVVSRRGVIRCPLSIEMILQEQFGF